jgi:hypothetical protein
MQLVAHAALDVVEDMQWHSAYMFAFVAKEASRSDARPGT